MPLALVRSAEDGYSGLLPFTVVDVALVVAVLLLLAAAALLLERITIVDRTPPAGFVERDRT